MLGYFNKWIIITFSNKTTKGEEFEEFHQVIIDGISDNMASLVQPNQYRAMNTTYSTKLGYYVAKHVSKDYTLKEDTTRDRKIIAADEISVKY